MQRQFDDDGFEFDRRILLGGAYRGLTDVGEVLVALDQVTDGDHESWISVFAALGDRIAAQADASAAAERIASARSANLRASSYYASAAGHAATGTDAQRTLSLWTRHRDRWDAAVAAFDPPVEKVAIPYGSTTLEGYFFHAHPGAAATTGGASGRYPTVILNNGSDGPVSDMWSSGGAAAVERGWNALVFDGPGQGAALYRQQLYFRADWEQVITPVVDHLLTRDDVDADRIALLGVSQAGYWVPRAAAFEHRLAACVADPGVMRVDTSWRGHLPDVMTQLLDSGDQKDFDAFMVEGMKDKPESLAELRWRMAPYGTTSFYAAYEAAGEMTLDAGTLAKITCPVLITSPENEQFWPGQSAEMHQALPHSTLVAFTEAEGADWHCEPAGRAVRDERIGDWLSGVFATVATS
ncbi:MAG: alpha/beta hydrolase family protein [Microthrixaceae bacterium]